jgi:hypothetical protein
LAVELELENDFVNELVAKSGRLQVSGCQIRRNAGAAGVAPIAPSRHSGIWTRSTRNLCLTQEGSGWRADSSLLVLDAGLDVHQLRSIEVSVGKRVSAVWTDRSIRRSM